MREPRESGGPPVTGVILAGGGATRFGGRAKGLETVGDARILDRVAAALAPACDGVLLIAQAPDASAWLPGVRTASDPRPGLGSLGGLHAALAHARTSVLVVAWDMPFVTAPLLVALRARGDAGARAVRPVHPDGRVEPLCAYYAASCLGTVERLLDAGERRARALGDAVGAATLDGAALAAFGDPAVVLSSVNAPDDLARARLLVDHPDSPPR